MMKRLLILPAVVVLGLTSTAQVLTDVIDGSLFNVDEYGVAQSFNDVTLPSGNTYSFDIALRDENSKALQLIAEKPQGIVSTRTTGEVTSVTVTWNTFTLGGRSIEVYGSNEPFTSPADLYDPDNTSVVHLTTLDYIPGYGDYKYPTSGYKYVGLASTNGKIYMDKVTITYEEPKEPTEPTDCNVTYTIGENGMAMFYDMSTIFGPIESGTILPSGSMLMVSIYPDEGYVIASYSVNGIVNQELTGEPYYTDMIEIEEDTDIRASFISEAELSSIMSVTDDTSKDAVYYNLQGVRVNNPVDGFYIMVSGNNARKVYIAK